MIHNMLQKILKEQTQINGQWSDDVDSRVQELKDRAGTTVCPGVSDSYGKGSQEVYKFSMQSVFKKYRERAPGK